MKLGMFELVEPLPVLNNPHVVAVLRPWTDAGNAGTMAISYLESFLSAKQLGKIRRPGTFFDFTRYRPMARYNLGKREIIVPNTIVTYARQEHGQDFIFLNMLEPNHFAEHYVSSILKLLELFGVQRYCVLGSMYDMVPHTRPLLVTGGVVGEKASEALKNIGITSSAYEGPTTICYLIGQEAVKLGIETVNIMVRLPQYTQLEKDFNGQVRMLEVIKSLYNIPIDETVIQQAERQIKEIDIAVNRSRKTKEAVTQLEVYYDAQSATKQRQEPSGLSPDIENFLREMENRFRQE
jgi:predicted ATP-grasp superfamily ATP-dependent carboligase